MVDVDVDAADALDPAGTSGIHQAAFFIDRGHAVINRVSIPSSNSGMNEVLERVSFRYEC